MESEWKSPGRGLVARLLALITLLAFVAVSADARRSSIKRRLPESREMRPFPDETGESLVSFVAPSSRALLVIGADASAAAQRGYHIDNVFVLKSTEFDVSTVDGNSCFQNANVRPLSFDVDSPFPVQQTMALFETFETDSWASGIPAGWELDRACWNGGLSAPRSVPATLNGSPCRACCGSNATTDACGPAPLRPFNCGPNPVFVDTPQRKFTFLDPAAGCTIPVCPGPGCGCPLGWETCATDSITLEPLACCPTEESCNQPRKWPGGSIALNSSSCQTAEEGEATVSIQLTGLEQGKEYIVQVWWGADGLQNIKQSEELFIITTDTIFEDGFESGSTSAWQ